MFYILALELFLRTLKANQVLCGITLHVAIILAGYSYADMSSAKIEVANKEIGKYKAVTGANLIATSP